jgi:hypothetical protein
LVLFVVMPGCLWAITFFTASMLHIGVATSLGKGIKATLPVSIGCQSVQKLSCMSGLALVAAAGSGVFCILCVDVTAEKQCAGSAKHMLLRDRQYGGVLLPRVGVVATLGVVLKPHTYAF